MSVPENGTVPFPGVGGKEMCEEILMVIGCEIAILPYLVLPVEIGAVVLP